MEVRNQRTAQSLLASCRVLHFSGPVRLEPQLCPRAPCGTVEKHVLGVVEEEKEKRPPFYFPSSKPVFFFWATEGNEEGRAGEDMQCTRCFRSILPVARTSISIYLYYESLFKCLTCLPCLLIPYWTSLPKKPTDSMFWHSTLTLRKTFFISINLIYR